VIALALLAGCGDGGRQGPDALAEPPAQVAETTAAPTSEPPAVLAEGFGAGPAATPTPRPTRSRKPRPKPSRRPPKETLLPPAPPKPAPASCKPRYVGTAISRTAAKQALTAAAGRTYWPVSAPDIQVPVNLVKATAWQESGWQSNIIACDGGVGLMQVMPDTAAFVNQRFEQSYDIDVPADNATLGANYLAWLIKYFGDVYYASDYTIDEADCATRTSPCLLNAVIAAYNFGFGAVDTDDGLVIPNPTYVANVRALMTECECLAF
jgi:soluble lytic murein transglycosylase-like protein